MVTHIGRAWRTRRYETGKRREAFVRWVAWRLPRELVMWCYIRVGANATTGRYGNTVVPEIGMMEALQRWDDDQSPPRRRPRKVEP